MAVTGLGPRGEKAAAPERLALIEADAGEARARQFTIAIVMQTTRSDWARQILAGITNTLGQYAAAVIDVTDCNFDTDSQIAALERLKREAPSAIISLPVGNTAVAEAHREVSRAGIRLVLMDNAPTGLLPGTDYLSVVSADNFGLGQIAAKLLSPHVPKGSTVGVLGYGVDFFVANEREIAFRKWMEGERPDVTLSQSRFTTMDNAADATAALLAADPGLAAMFAVWDEPAMRAVKVLREQSRIVPMTTVDLGNSVAIELARGDLVKGVAAQRPYDQGVLVARAAIMALVGKQPPAWVALPGLSVTASNMIEAYQIVWHAAAPPELIKARRNRRVT